MRRLAQECHNSEEEDPDAEVLGVCHRPGCVVFASGFAKTLIGCWTVTLLPQVSDPAGCQTSHPSSSKASATVLNAGELEWRVGGKTIHFVAHVVSANSGLSRPDLKAFSAPIDQLHLPSLRVTQNLASRTPRDGPLGPSSSVVKVEQRT